MEPGIPNPAHQFPNYYLSKGGTYAQNSGFQSYYQQPYQPPPANSGYYLQPHHNIPTPYNPYPTQGVYQQQYSQNMVPIGQQNQINLTQKIWKPSSFSTKNVSFPITNSMQPDQRQYYQSMSTNYGAPSLCKKVHPIEKGVGKVSKCKQMSSPVVSSNSLEFNENSQQKQAYFNQK